MESRVRLLRHPAHPLLVVFPTALLPLLLFLDVLHFWLGDASFWTVGFWVAAAGVATTLAAMVPGLVDLAAIPGETRAHRTALLHLAVGLTVLAAFAVSAWIRLPVGSAPDGATAAALVDAVGVGLVAAQGWLGGELVYRHHVGVKSLGEGGDPVALTPPGRRSGARGAARRRGASRP